MTDWKKDSIAIRSAAVVTGSAVAALEKLGVSVPGSVLGGIVLGITAVVAGVRLYARIVGPENTRADDVLDAVEDEIVAGAKELRK